MILSSLALKGTGQIDLLASRLKLMSGFANGMHTKGLL